MKNYTSFHSKKNYRLFVRLFFLIVIVSLLAFFTWWGLSLWKKTLTKNPAQVNVLELWKNGNYDEILAHSKEELKVHPLDSGALIFSGFSAFQKGLSETSEEMKEKLVDQSIVDLRKALLLSNSPLKPQIHYILGKAYFQKGKYYADESITQLTEALAMGYKATDINEYLGLDYNVLGRYQDAAKYFLEAVKTSNSDVLIWTLGQTYFQIGDMDKATEYLLKALNLTKDNSLEQRIRFLLGSIYRKLKNYDLATLQYQAILNKNPNSADAYYYLGEIQSSLGNKVMARSYWRKAFRIDPLHFNANQRLFN
jgi:tetratricopeptide (TPR) repeat protein